jgi:GNAT superfamily N-acetyltransferase
MEQFRIRVENPEFVKQTIVAIKLSNTSKEDAEQLMGFITTRTENYEIYQVFVAKDARGSGIAKELLRQAEEYLKSYENNKTNCGQLSDVSSEQKDKKHVIIHLYASIGNCAAKRFYENNGWKTVKEEIFQAEVVRNERKNWEPQDKLSNTSPKITYFPVPCYRLEKLLYLK